MNPSNQPPEPNPPKRRRIPVEFVETRREYEIREITGMVAVSGALQLGAEHAHQQSLFPIRFKAG